MGGINKLGVNDGSSDDLEEEAPNVVICTGANVCGKVRDVFRSSSNRFLKRLVCRAFTKQESLFLAWVIRYTNCGFLRPLLSSTWHR